MQNAYETDERDERLKSDDGRGSVDSRALLLEDKFANLAEDSELVKKAQDAIADYFDVHDSQRVDLEERWRMEDNMYASGQNRANQSADKRKGMNLEKDTRANTGSTMFFKQVNSLAAGFVTACRSRPEFFKYTTLPNEHVPHAEEKGKANSEAMNLLVKWNLKKDNFDERLPEFATHIYKYSTVFAMMHWHRVMREKLSVTPAEEGAGGEQEEVSRVEVLENYAKIEFPHVSTVYADYYIPRIADQMSVELARPRSKSQVYAEVKAGHFLNWEKAKKLEWDGEVGGRGLQNEEENRNSSFNASDSKLMLQFDCWTRLPITDEGVWDDEAECKLYWSTWIGNTIGDAVCVRLMRNNDPDDEIPLKEIRVNADQADLLYHTSNGSVVRSLYSTDCTLLNLTLDTMAAILDPPISVLDGYHRITDFTFRKGQRWHVDRHDALRQFDIRDATPSAISMRAQIREEQRDALNVSAAMAGKFAGSRTSATEAMGVNRESSAPNNIQIGYIMSQLFPWMARKYQSYWKTFGLPDQVVHITSDSKQYEVALPIEGDYEISVDIINDFSKELTRRDTIDQVLQVIAASPFLQSSPTHQIDTGELMKEYFRFKGWDASKIVLPPMGVDAEYVAREENRRMIDLGEAVPPMDGENSAVHLRIHEAEMLRWKNVSPESDKRAIHAQLLQSHIEQTRQRLSGGVGAGVGQYQEGATPPNVPPEGGVGAAAAASIGAMMGGGVGL